MITQKTLNYDFEIQTRNLPINLYSLRILDIDKKENHDIVISHNGYCPKIYSEREQSNYNDYLSNLENSLLIEFEKTTKIKNYERVFEVMTDKEGKLFHFCKKA